MNLTMSDSRLFNEFGCLTGEAIESYIAKTLGEKDLKDVLSHLENCDFCANAIDGIKLSESSELNISEIKNEIKDKTRQKTSAAKQSNRIFILSTFAASILFILGLFYIFNLKSDSQNAENITDEENNSNIVYFPPSPGKEDVQMQQDKKVNNLSVAKSEINLKKLFTLDNMNKPDFSNQIFTFTEEMPEFPGGVVALDKTINKEIEYAENTYNIHSCGKVFVEFLINEKGEITDPVIVGKKKKGLDQVAIEIVKKLPRWIPGKQSGQAVKVSYTLPIKFSKC